MPAFVKLADLKDGDVVQLDDGFTCHSAGQCEVHDDGGRLYFRCSEGRHYLDGQCDEHGTCVGVIKL